MYWIDSQKGFGPGRFCPPYWKKLQCFTSLRAYIKGLLQMKDNNLLPYILPNVFAISTALSPSQFASTVLPSLKPLFSIKDPPQNMLTLLDNLSMLQSKTDKAIFKDRESRILWLRFTDIQSQCRCVTLGI